MQIKIFKKIIFLILFVSLICTYETCYANSSIDTNIAIGTTTGISVSKDYTEGMLGVIQTIGTVFSLVALLIIGIRYMSSSVEEKAEMKGVLQYYIIGAILVFATSNVLSIAYQILWNI